MPRKTKNFPSLALIFAISIAPLNSFALDRKDCFDARNNSLGFLEDAEAAKKIAMQAPDERYEEFIKLSYKNLELAADWASIYTAFCKE